MELNIETIGQTVITGAMLIYGILLPINIINRNALLALPFPISKDQPLAILLITGVLYAIGTIVESSSSAISSTSVTITNGSSAHHFKLTANDRDTALSVLFEKHDTIFTPTPLYYETCNAIIKSRAFDNRPHTEHNNLCSVIAAQQKSASTNQEQASRAIPLKSACLLSSENGVKAYIYCTTSSSANVQEKNLSEHSKEIYYIAKNLIFGSEKYSSEVLKYEQRRFFIENIVVVSAILIIWHIAIIFYVGAAIPEPSGFTIQEITKARRNIMISITTLIALMILCSYSHNTFGAYLHKRVFGYYVSTTIDKEIENK